MPPSVCFDCIWTDSECKGYRVRLQCPVSLDVRPARDNRYTH